MAIVWAEGWEQYGNNGNLYTLGLWSDTPFTGQLLTDGTARTGTNYFEITRSDGLGALRRTVPDLTVFGFALGIRLPQLPTTIDRVGILFRTSNATVCSISIDNVGNIRAHIGPKSNPVITTSSRNFVAGSWQHLEIKINISDTSGSIECSLDNSNVLSATNINLGTTPIDEVYFDIRDERIHIDDLVIWDNTGPISNDWIGPARTRLQYFENDAVSAVNDWVTTGAPSAAEAIDDEPPDDDTSYISAENVNDTITLAMGQLPTNIDNIVGVYLLMYARQEDAGITNLTPKIQTGSLETVGDEVALTSNYVYYGQEFTVNPTGNVAWTKATLEAAIIELERT